MPLQRPHYWHEDAPVTHNQTYGWFHRDEHPRRTPTGWVDKEGYKVINKPCPDLTYRPVRVSSAKLRDSDDTTLPSIINARNDQRKAISDPTYMGQSYLGDGKADYTVGTNKHGFRPVTSYYEEAPDQARRIIGKSLGHSYLRPKTVIPNSWQTEPVKNNPLYLWHTNSGYLVRVVK